MSDRVAFALLVVGAAGLCAFWSPGGGPRPAAAVACAQAAAGGAVRIFSCAAPAPDLASPRPADPSPPRVVAARP